MNNFIRKRDTTQQICFYCRGFSTIKPKICYIWGLMHREKKTTWEQKNDIFLRKNNNVVCFSLSLSPKKNDEFFPKDIKFQSSLSFSHRNRCMVKVEAITTRAMFSNQKKVCSFEWKPIIFVVVVVRWQSRRSCTHSLVSFF